MFFSAYLCIFYAKITVTILAITDIISLIPFISFFFEFRYFTQKNHSPFRQKVYLYIGVSVCIGMHTHSIP